MSRPDARNLDVSPEEERFLRRAFRRFALPYLAGVAVLAAAAGWAASSATGTPDPALRAELEAVQTRLEALSGRVAALGTGLEGDRERLAALEDRTADAGGDALASLEGELRSVRNRMFDLEKRLERQPSPDRLAAVLDRLGRLEGEVASVKSAAPTRPAAPDPTPFGP